MKKWNGYQKGVNLGGWFSQCDYSEERFNNFITEDDFREISKWGLDHVRIPIDYNLVETEDGTFKESGFAHLDRAVGWCGKYGLNMILDLHRTAGYSFDSESGKNTFFDDGKLQERFYRLWEELAERYSKYSRRLAFELLNEVTDQSYSEAWNSISAEAIERIRKISQDVTILVGGYWNNSIDALKDLRPPRDENIVYNFHCYGPILFTHQHAYWAGGLGKMPEDVHVVFPDTVQSYLDTISKYVPGGIFTGDIERHKLLGEEYFEACFADGIKLAEERNVRLYCGEYGVIDHADLQSTVNWYKAINSVFVRHGIGRAAWSYKEMDFGLSDKRMKPVIDEIISLL
jgi:hypothetical protein